VQAAKLTDHAWTVEELPGATISLCMTNDSQANLDFSFRLHPVIKVVAGFAATTFVDLVGSAAYHFRNPLGRRTGVGAVADRLGYQEKGGWFS